MGELVVIESRMKAMLDLAIAFKLFLLIATERAGYAPNEGRGTRTMLWRCGSPRTAFSMHRRTTRV